MRDNSCCRNPTNRHEVYEAIFSDANTAEAVELQETAPPRERRPPMHHIVARRVQFGTALVQSMDGITASQWTCRALARDAGKANSYQPKWSCHFTRDKKPVIALLFFCSLGHDFAA